MAHIDRRDFLNGVALTVGASLAGISARATLGFSETAAPSLANTTRQSGFYPPALTGMRGSHDGSFDVMHGIAWGDEKIGPADNRVDASYDLVVVGAGLSGLAAARFYQQDHPEARILILDNHDDFGGHARRNEFVVDGQHLIGHGGSQSIDTPSGYSEQAAGLMKDIGIETQRFYDYFDRDFYESRNMSMGLFLSEDTFGTDHLQKLPIGLLGGFGLMFGGADLGNDSVKISSLPLPQSDKDKLREMVFGVKDYLAGKSDDEKLAYLKTVTYTEYLQKNVGVSDLVVSLLDRSLAQLFALPWSTIPASYAIDLLMPATRGLGLGPTSAMRFAATMRGLLPRGMWRSLTDSLLAEEGMEPYIFHFPDGNASIARLLVRKMMPHVTTGTTMEDIVQAPLDYDQLDSAAHLVRCRLNSTVVDVRHNADRSSVDVSYMQNESHERVTAAHVILACNHTVIPYICHELPAAQKAAMKKAERSPLCYINVALRNWRAFEKAGVHRIYAPTEEIPHLLLDFPVSMGGVEFSQDPDQPIVLHMSYTPSSALDGAGKTHRELYREGQHVIYSKTFEDFEDSIKAQLDRMLGLYGFRSENDIAAITVNRWTHGYAYTPYGYKGDPMAEDAASPHHIARKSHHRISMANSDAEYDAYVDSAIDAGWRAVQEQNALR